MHPSAPPALRDCVSVEFFAATSLKSAAGRELGLRRLRRGFARRRGCARRSAATGSSAPASCRTPCAPRPRSAAWCACARTQGRSRTRQRRIPERLRERGERRRGAEVPVGPALRRALSALVILVPAFSTACRGDLGLDDRRQPGRGDRRASFPFLTAWSLRAGFFAIAASSPFTVDSSTVFPADLDRGRGARAAGGEHEGRDAQRRDQPGAATRRGPDEHVGRGGKLWKGLRHGQPVKRGCPRQRPPSTRSS